MMIESKKVVIITSSPKVGETSTSEFLASLGMETMKSGNTQFVPIDVRKCFREKSTQEAFEVMRDADAHIYVFPLYFFCLPGILMRFLQDYQAYLKSHKEGKSAVKIYSIINCGFPEPEINREAARVLECYSQHNGYHSRFSVLIGGGGMLMGASKAPFMKKTMGQLKDAFGRILGDVWSLDQGICEDILISVNFPSRLYLFMGNNGWPVMAKKNGLKKKQLYRAPYHE